MQLHEGKNNHNNFGNDQLSGININYDGHEKLVMRFDNAVVKDWCEVTLDWIEEIKSFSQMADNIWSKGERECKLYPDDFRGLMMRTMVRPNETEIQFLKNYQAVRVVMGKEKAEEFWKSIDRVLKEPGTIRLKFS
ncbi:MAG: hypothetical protein ACM3MK_07820 [Chitinophagales bacterium]